MKIFKPIYKKNCNWCKFLRYGMSDISECTKTGEKIIFIEEILNNKTCNNFKCNDSSRTLLDRIKDIYQKVRSKQ